MLDEHRISIPVKIKPSDKAGVEGRTEEADLTGTWKRYIRWVIELNKTSGKLEPSANIGSNTKVLYKALIMYEEKRY